MIQDCILEFHPERMIAWVSCTMDPGDKHVFFLLISFNAQNSWRLFAATELLLTNIKLMTSV